MKRLLFLFPLLISAQVTTIPNTTFPAVRSMMNANFGWLNTNKAGNSACPANQYAIQTTTAGVVCASLTSGQLTTALGFTPENAANKGQNGGYLGIGADGSATIGATLPDGAPAGVLAASIVYSPNGALNVKAFGAAPGNSAAANTTAFTAAFAAASAAGGGEVFVPPGTYLVNPLTKPAKVSLVGGGAAGTVLQAAAAGVMLTTTAGAKGEAIRDLTFDCHGVASTAILDNVSLQARYDSFFATGCASFSLILSGTQNSFFTNFELKSGGGIQLTVNGALGADNNVLEKWEVNSPTTTTLAGIEVDESASGNVFDQGIVEYTPGVLYGIWLKNAVAPTGYYSIQNEFRTVTVVGTAAATALVRVDSKAVGTLFANCQLVLNGQSIPHVVNNGVRTQMAYTNWSGSPNISGTLPYVAPSYNAAQTALADSWTAAATGAYEKRFQRHSSADAADTMRLILGLADDSPQRAVYIEAQADCGWGNCSSLGFYTGAYTTSGPTLSVRMPQEGGVQLKSRTRPTCDLAHAGTFFYVAGGVGVKDTVDVCAKAADNAYAWRLIY